MQKFSLIFLLISCIFSLTACTSPEGKHQHASAQAGSPVAEHGALSVSGKHIIGEHGRPVSLAGPSFFWSNNGWAGERFYNKGAVKFFAKEWDAGIVRAAIGGHGGGSYLQDPQANHARAKVLIDAAIANGIYVVLDWHSHHAEENTDEAIAFFKRFATEYGHTHNIIYEIYNEPLLNTDWATTIKPYAEKVIAEIRKIDPDNLIIVGTQAWSQYVDKAADNPIKGFKNIAYTLHFYAGSHKQNLRSKASYALEKGLPLMVTEWGSVNANGDGAVDKTSSNAWLDFLKKHQLSHMVWAANDKDEGASFFVPGAPMNGGWTDKHLTESGKFARDVIKHWDKR